MPSSELVVIRTSLNYFEAELLRSALKAAGIESMLRSDDCGGQRPHMWMSGIELLVRSEDAVEATEIIDTGAIFDTDDQPPEDTGSR